MTAPALLTEITRGPIVESYHTGHAVICDASGGIVDAWGDPRTMMYPRSSAKMLQALPLVGSCAADAQGLSTAQLALSCASHNGAAIHSNPVNTWLDDMGLSDDDLRCGPQMPKDRAAFNELIKTGGKPCQAHNNCSGKHAGFLALSKHIGGGPEYIDIDHPVQKAVLDAFEELTQETSPDYGLDGCSAPNFICSIHAMARAMAFFANARDGANVRETAAVRLWQAMAAHPALVAGSKRACTELMQACSEPVALKTGAEGYFIAIIPGRKLGIALKVSDGSTRASNCTIAALLVRVGVLDPNHPAALKFMNAPVLNRRGIETGKIAPAPALL